MCVCVYWLRNPDDRNIYTDLRANIRFYKEFCRKLHDRTNALILIAVRQLDLSLEAIRN
jgi:hypothetical protein